MPSARGSAFAARAVLTGVLAIGFYVLALAVVAVSTGLPAYFMATTEYTEFLVFFLVIGAVFSGFVVWSTIPRRAPEPDEPLLAPGSQPRLEAEVARIAAALGQRPPDDIRVAAVPNAGVMEARRRKVLLVGMPLFALLTAGELRGILAHEFSHFAGGDTKLRWVGRARRRLHRTVESLTQSDYHEAGFNAPMDVIRWPFWRYAQLFDVVSGVIVRQQEFHADGDAARVVGSDAYATALRRVHESDAVLELFLRTATRHSPLIDGLAEFRSTPEAVRAAAEAGWRAMALRQPHPYDSHPPLTQRLDRIEALAAQAAHPGDDDAEPARVLLDDPAALEALILKRA